MNVLCFSKGQIRHRTATAHQPINVIPLILEFTETEGTKDPKDIAFYSIIQSALPSVYQHPCQFYNREENLNPIT